MTTKKVKGVLRIEFLDNYPTQVVLADYLRQTGDAKANVLSATTAYFYPIALAKIKGTSRQEMQMALSNALRELDNQKKYLTEYYRIHQGIEIALDPCPIPISSPVPISPAITSVGRLNVGRDEEDDENYECQIGDPNSVISLNF